MNNTRKIIFVVLLMIMSGCVKNQPKEPNSSSRVPSGTTPLTDGSEYTKLSTLLSSNMSSGLPELTYYLEFSALAPIQRIFVLVDGQPSEFSLNGSEMAEYQDMKGKDFSSEKMLIRPKVKGKKKGDSVTISPVLVLMDESLVFPDYYTYSLYFGDSFGVDVDVELEEFEVGAVVPRNFEFSKNITVEHNNEKDYVIKDIIESSQTVQLLGIQTKDMVNNTVSRDGYVYDRNLDYYLTKIGIHSIIVYPLLNGEYMKKDDQIVSFYFPESNTPDEMFYTPFELQEFDIKEGDIITLVIWDTEKKTLEHGPAKIAIESE